MNSCKEDLVSIIVPVYNTEPYIRECIESIQRQSYHHIEILIVDDGSTDGSGELCEEIAATDDRILVIRQKNQGVVAARGKGVEASIGKYIAFVDSDDWIEPDMIEQMLKLIGERELLTTGVYLQETPNKVIEKCDAFPEGLYAGEVRMSEILRNMIYDFDRDYLQRFTPWMWNKLFLSKQVKEVYQEVDPGVFLAEDAVFVYKYFLKCSSIVISHQCFYHYRYRKESVVHAQNNRMLMNINKVYLALETDFRNHKLGDCLLYQLQRWILVMNCEAINVDMGFDERIHIPEFIVDASGLENKRLILYGAGKIGKVAYTQFQKFGYHIVLWADKNFKYCQSIGMPVVSPDEIFGKEYDVIYIAVKEEALAEKIKKELSEKGIPKNRFMWKKLVRIY